MSTVRLSRPLLVLALASSAFACSSSVNDSTATNQKVPGGDASSGGSSGSGATNGGATNGGATNGGGGGAANVCNGPHSTAVGRGTTTACKPSPILGFLPDSASTACTTDTDCSLPLRCFHGTCSLDSCLADGDCSTGLACVCADAFYGSNGVHGNICVPAQCRTDADCSPSGVCSPSFGETCGGPTGVFCHSAEDTCNTDADCCGATPACRYQQALGHWACQSFTVCNG